MQWLIAVSLVLWWSPCTSAVGSGVEVSCKKDANTAVDWFILYKVPRRTKKEEEAKQPAREGFEYAYIDKTGKIEYHKNPIYKEVLLHTLEPMLKSEEEMPNSFGFLSYSDQPPGAAASAATSGHSKGLVMGDSETKTALWLTHSTPQFPLSRDPERFWPDSGHENGQTFMCVSLEFKDLDAIGIHLQHIRAHPFDKNLPDAFSNELKKHVDTIHSNPLALNELGNIKPLTTTKKQTPQETNLKTVAKKTVEKKPNKKLLPSEVKEGDLYVQLAEEFNSGMYVHNWGKQTRKNDDISNQARPIYTILEIYIDAWNWKTCRDHSKWAVTTNTNNVHWTCIGDSNHAPSQSSRPGGALCINNAAVHGFFSDFRKNRAGPSSSSSDMVVDSDCSDDSSDSDEEMPLASNN